MPETSKSDDLLKNLKISIGNLLDDGSLDDYYKAQLDIALADLLSEDIDEKTLNTPIGIATQVLYAQALIEKQDISSNSHLTFLKNKLSAMTKGNRLSEEN